MMIVQVIVELATRQIVPPIGWLRDRRLAIRSTPPARQPATGLDHSAQFAGQ
jgi:hypothetical protein